MIASTSLLITAAWLRDANPQQQASSEGQLLRHGLRHAGASGRALHWITRNTAGSAFLRWAERHALPGIAAHYRWRKRMIETWAQDALRNGVRQVVVLGAGLDSLPVRLALQHSRGQVLEIDRTDAMRLKTRALEASFGLPANLRLLPADLSTGRVMDVLGSCDAFDPTRPTLVIAEGLLMYLPKSQAIRTARELSTSLAPGSCVIATAMQVDARGHIGFQGQPHWLGTWLRRSGEPFRWGIPQHGIAGALQRVGLRLQALADPAHDPCPGEWVFLTKPC